MIFLFNKKTLSLVLIFSLLSCGNVKRISGEIVHKKGVPHSYQGNFLFTSSSHAVVRIIQWQGADHSEVLKEKTFKDIQKFPIKFSINLDKVLDFSKFSYSVSAEVFSKEGGKRAGDLLTEEIHELKSGQTFIELLVIGVEECKAEGSGGFCI